MPIPRARVTLVWLPPAARDFDTLREPYRTQVDVMLTRFALYGEGDVARVMDSPGALRLKTRSHREHYRVRFRLHGEQMVILAVERRDKV
ncbi:MAG: hypothetical protein HY321_21755 [Armatimonadetes bacterium]|nr:hypothetical protein [Armatimonadota bacterium]